MIVDLRIYTCRPQRMAEFVELYREHAWPLQQKYLGRCLGWYTTVEGPLNRVVHLWGYDSQADREARRAAPPAARGRLLRRRIARRAMAADPAWGAYLALAAERNLLVEMENRLLRPTEFSPVR